MEHNVVVRMAKVLYGMVLAVFVFNLLVLPLVPGYTMMAYKGMGMGHPSISSLMGTMRSLLGAGVPAWEILVVRPLAMLGGDWSGYGPEVWWSAAFFLGCGICTAVLLWQARCILSTIIAQTPFQRSNARSMKRAAASCWGHRPAGGSADGGVVPAAEERSPAVHLHSLVHSGVADGGPAFPGDVCPVPPGGGAERGPGPDHLRGRSMKIVVNLDVMMARRKMSLGELAQKVDITMANLSILKNNKARAIRFSTLEAICAALDCQPGDILEFVPEEGDR